MHDRDIVAAIVVGDPAGLAAAYDSYAGALHAYCRSLLGEPADAADAVQDTFVIASAKLGGLRDRDRLRPWLYAVARNECHRRLRARSRTAALDEAGEMSDNTADLGAGQQRAELRELVRAAVAGLNPGDREVIELNLRHDLDGGDLADALGVPPNQAHALASRARGQLERSLGALLVARAGRSDCPELADLLAGWNGQLTVLLRKRVSRHIERCETCGERKRWELSPSMLLSALPVIVLPPGLRHQVLALVADVHPDAVRYREHVASRAEPFSASGFPEPVQPACGRRPRGRNGGWPGGWIAAQLSGRSTAYAAAALVVLASVALAVTLLLRHGPAPATAAAVATLTPTPSVTAVLPAPSPSPFPSQAGSPKPSPSASAPAALPPPAPSLQPPSPQPSAPSPSPSPSSRPRPSPSPRPRPSPSPSPTPSPGTIEVSVSSVQLAQPGSTATFMLTAVGGPVKYSVAVPQSAAAGLTVSPAGGSLPAGQSVTVTVTAVGNGPPDFQTPLTVSPGGEVVTVFYPPSG